MCCRALALRRSVSLLVAICIVYIRLLELYVSVFYSVDRFLECGNAVDFQVVKIKMSNKNVNAFPVYGYIKCNALISITRRITYNTQSFELVSLHCVLLKKTIARHLMYPKKTQ